VTSPGGFLYRRVGDQARPRQRRRSAQTARHGRVPAGVIDNASAGLVDPAVAGRLILQLIDIPGATRRAVRLRGAASTCILTGIPGTGAELRRSLLARVSSSATEFSYSASINFWAGTIKRPTDFCGEGRLKEL
jgi:hypothetical protein